VFSDFELLCNFGLIDHIHVPVGGAEKNEAWIGARIDRRLSTFGRRYYEGRLRNTYFYVIIYEIIKGPFDSAHGDLKKMFALEAELLKIDVNDEKRDTIYVKIEELRRAITDEHKFTTLRSE